MYKLITILQHNQLTVHSSELYHRCWRILASDLPQTSRCSINSCKTTLDVWMMTGFPLMAVMVWAPSEADSVMKFNMPDIYLGVCFWNKHLLKGGDGSRSGQRGKSYCNADPWWPQQATQALEQEWPSDYPMLCQHGQVFLGLHRSIVLFCFCYILPLIGEPEA